MKPKISTRGDKFDTLNDFPENFPAPALRALLGAKIYGLAHLSKHTETEILELHGMGPKAIKLLTFAMEEKKLAFKK